MKRLALELVDRLSGRVWKTGPFANKADSFDVQQLANLIAALESAKYYTKYMLKCKTFQNTTDLLSYALSVAALPGAICEFGVASGSTINHIAHILPGRQIHGFDGFVGLPENWRSGFPAGAFAQAIPAVEANVKLHVGLFSETLPQFASSLQEDMAFIHVDCDLYSSTKEIFFNLGSRIKSGTVIVFDEYMNYPGWKQHEWKAFREYTSSSNLKYQYIGLVPSHQQVAVMIE
jgi:Macrocin-O-methyltransferase (TylF)